MGICKLYKIYNAFGPVIRRKTMDETMKKNIIKYLKAAKVLIESNDMEEIIGERDTYYGEESQVQECIDYINSL